MKTLSYLQKKHPHQKSMKETDCLKVDKDLLTKFLVVARSGKVDLGEILTHCLSQFPSILNNSDGSLQRTNKSALFHYCCDAGKRKTQGTQKGLIEKHIYSSNRNKIQVNLVKQ